jgi:hypothetical protein
MTKHIHIYDRLYDNPLHELSVTRYNIEHVFLEMTLSPYIDLIKVVEGYKLILDEY